MGGLGGGEAQCKSPDISNRVHVDFENDLPKVPRWFVIDDRVMGGVSQSSIQWDSTSRCVAFAGHVTTDSNGGFASVRTDSWSGWASNAMAIELLVRGDGRQYKVNFKCDDTDVRWEHPFVAQTDSWHSEGYLAKVLPSEAPRTSETFDDVLSDLTKHIIPGLTQWQSTKFFGYFPSSTSDPAVFAEILTSMFALVPFSWVTSPASTELEIIVMDWLVELCGLPDAFHSSTGKGGGVLQPSASEASLVAILGARERCLENNPGADALLVAYSSEQAHFAFEKGARIAGIKHIRLLPASRENNYSLQADTLQQAIAQDVEAGLIPFFVNASIGTTSSCAVDDVAGLATVGRSVGAWVHVDAAYAGSAGVCPEMRHYFVGLQLVDSYDFNPHKWLLTNHDCSAMFFSDRTYILRALTTSHAYLTKPSGQQMVDFKDLQIPLGRRFKSLKLWFVLRMYGQENLQEFIRHHVKLAKYFELLVCEHAQFELCADPQFGLVCFRMKGQDNEAQSQLLEQLNNSGEVFLTGTTLDGKKALRLALGGARTQQKDVQETWELIVSEASSIIEGAPRTSVPVNGVGLALPK